MSADIVGKAKQQQENKDRARLVSEAREAKRAHANTRANLESALKAAESRAETAEAQLEAVLGAEESYEPGPIKPIAKTGRLPEATLISLLSDWHVGQRVRPEMVGGLNEYTPDIASERAHNFFRNLLTMLKVSRAGWNVNQLVLSLLGDFCNGWIHDEYKAENYLSPTEEMYLAFELLADGIRFLLKESDCERILVPSSSGNHGRLTEKRHTADFRTSLEFIMYRLLKREFREEKRVEFKLGVGTENHFRVYDRMIGQQHGDEIKSQGGVGGIYPALYRRLTRVNSGALATYMMMYGHWHQYGNAPRTCGNGSLIGFDSYAEQKGFTPEPPQQACFVIDSKYQCASFMNPIFVEKIKK